jgi:hypothetical protein
MADVVGVTAERAHPFSPIITIKNVVTCINCAQTKRQLDNVLFATEIIAKK